MIVDRKILKSDKENSIKITLNFLRYVSNIIIIIFSKSELL